MRPDLEGDDLDLLDPWVIDGRYAADLPDVELAVATRILTVSRAVVDAVRPLVSPTTHVLTQRPEDRLEE